MSKPKQFAAGKKGKKSKGSLARRAHRTHAELAICYERLGKGLFSARVSAKPTLRFCPGLKYKTGRIKKLLTDPSKLSSNDKFGRSYRSIQSAQDELVSTSSIRELLKGVTSSGALSPKELKDIEPAFELLSMLRFPTKWTGYSLASESMQHPTRASDALFADPAVTASRHNELDLQRRNEVAGAMEVEARKPKSTLQSIIKAAMRSAIEFSLNAFIAPITASDVFPHAKASKAMKPSEQDDQLEARENLKKILHELGGTQEAGLVDRGRHWSMRRDKRSASPPRIDRKRASKFAPIVE